jgi:hypothetical protein
MRAYEIFTDFGEPSPTAQYAYASRKALMPAIVSNRLDFFDLPVEYRNHSPKTLLKVLKFFTRDFKEAEIEAQLRAADIPYEKVFERKEEYRRFLAYFLANLYSSEKHQQAYELAKLYYTGWMTSTDVAFDMGYSGRIQEAICRWRVSQSMCFLCTATKCASRCWNVKAHFTRNASMISLRE